jgi:L-threonylcarbamoyladenylate synthase
MSIAQMQEALDQAPQAHDRVALWSRNLVAVPAAWSQQVVCQPMPTDARQCAHDLFAQLRTFDAQGMTQIWVETPVSSTEWDGVRDRLSRAATPAR